MGWACHTRTGGVAAKQRKTAALKPGADADGDALNSLDLRPRCSSTETERTTTLKLTSHMSVSPDLAPTRTVCINWEKAKQKTSGVARKQK